MSRKKIILVLVAFWFIKASVLFGQQLYYQNNFRGGVCGDGISYTDIKAIFPDTITFSNIIPPSANIERAFIITHKSNSYVDVFPKHDFIYSVTFNGSIVTIDSSNEVTPFFFNCYNPTSAFQKISVKDVTSLALHSNNVLITPQQTPVVNDYTYSGYYLLILYSENSMPLTNVCIFITNQSYSTSMTHNLQGLNMIDNSLDAGLSIWSQYTTVDYPLNFTLNSSAGSFPLGVLLERTIPSTGLLSENLPGSFNYSNNLLAGLDDDTPDAFIDSTDALANIKNYVNNNTQSFTLLSTTNINYLCSGAIDAFFLAYSTPCPAHGFKDTLTTHTICQGQNVTIGVQSPGNIYNWSPSSTLSSATNISPIASPTTTTNYIVSVDSMGCKHTEQVTVMVSPAPKADTIQVGDNFCGGPAGSLVTTPGHGPYEPYSYSLNGGAFTNDTTFSNLNVGSYTVTIKDNAGCTWQSSSYVIKDTLAANVYASAMPATGVSPFATIITSQSSIGVNTYNWYINNIPANTASSFNYTFTQEGSYNVTLIAYNNIPQCSDTASFTIHVLAQDTSGIFIPNVFSPNADGVNDVFEVRLVNCELHSFEIYNRFGIRVFNSPTSQLSNSPIVSWDGHTTSGEACSEGTYFYVISYKARNAQNQLEEKSAKGFLSLVR